MLLTGNDKPKERRLGISLVVVLVMSMLQYTNSQCSTFSPRTASQCYYYSNHEEFCCHLTRFEENTAYSVCHKIPVTKYSDISDTGYLLLGVNNYTIINCGYSEGVTCSDKTPLIPDDCYDNDTSESRCCMIEVPGRKKRCVYSGNPLKAFYTTKNGITIRCSAGYLRLFGIKANVNFMGFWIGLWVYLGFLLIIYL